jgi:hypothetical protein
MQAAVCASVATSSASHEPWYSRARTQSSSIPARGKEAVGVRLSNRCEATGVHAGLPQDELFPVRGPSSAQLRSAASCPIRGYSLVLAHRQSGR